MPRYCGESTIVKGFVIKMNSDMLHDDRPSTRHQYSQATRRREQFSDSTAALPA